MGAYDDRSQSRHEGASISAATSTTAGPPCPTSTRSRTSAGPRGSNPGGHALHLHMVAVAGPLCSCHVILPAELALMRQNSAAREGVGNAGERLTRREIVGHPQPRLATGADQQGGPMKQFEAERLHALQQGHDGVLPGAAPRRGARLELEVRQQVVGEHHELLPRTVGGVGLGRDAVEGQPGLELRDGLLVVAPPTGEVPQVADRQREVTRDRRVFVDERPFAARVGGMSSPRRLLLAEACSAAGLNTASWPVPAMAERRQCFEAGVPWTTSRRHAHRCRGRSWC